MRVRPSIIVGERNDGAAGESRSNVARVGKSAVLDAHNAKTVRTRDVSGAVRGPVIDDDHFEVRILKFVQTIEAVADRACAIVAAHHDGDGRPFGVGGEWNGSI